MAGRFHLTQVLSVLILKTGKVFRYRLASVIPRSCLREVSLYLRKTVANTNKLLDKKGRRIKL
jgi:hypothetical protein